MKVPHGYTWKEVFTAFAVIALVTLVVVLVIGPERQLAKERDQVREEGVRDLMEVMLEMSYDDYQAYSQIIGTVASGQTMIGTATDCSGSYGVMCNDIILRDTCIDLAQFGALDYIERIPVDAHHKYFSEERTGYYLYVENGTLEVGACHPELRDQITLQADL